MIFEVDKVLNKNLFLLYFGLGYVKVSSALHGLDITT